MLVHCAFTNAKNTKIQLLLILNVLVNTKIKANK